jgi:hypothetical protein
MPTFIRSRIVSTFLGASFCLPLAALGQSPEAQSTSQGSPVADAARRSRDKKKNPSSSAKSTKVITDDDLDRVHFQPGPDVLNVGASPKSETEAASTQAVAAAEATDNAAEQDGVKAAGEHDAEIARLKSQITEAERDLDLVRRQLTLDQDIYLANPDYAHDVAGKAKLDGAKQRITDKQQDVERLKTRLAAVEELKSQPKPARKQAASPAQTENAPAAQNPAQTENPPQAENPPQSEKPPGAPPRR